MALRFDDGPWWPKGETTVLRPDVVQICRLPSVGFLRLVLHDSSVPETSPRRHLQIGLTADEMRDLALALVRSAQEIEQAKNATN